MGRFYLRWASTAFWHSWGVSDFISTALGLLVPFMGKLIPDWNPGMTELAWQIPLTIFVTFTLVRLLLAPWWMHNEDQAVARKQHEELAASINALQEHVATLKDNSPLAEARRKLIRRSGECDAYLSWLQSGSQSLELQAVRKIEEWDSEILELVRDFYPTEFPKFMDNPFRGDVHWNVLTPNTAAIKGLVREQLKKLKELLKHK